MAGDGDGHRYRWTMTADENERPRGRGGTSLFIRREKGVPNMSTGLEKIIALIRRTGDRCVVVDAAGDPAFVVLPLEEYERLALPSSARRRDADALVTRLDQQAAEPAASSPAAVLSPFAPADPPSGSGHTDADQYFFEPIE